jgi:toxin CcdB
VGQFTVYRNTSPRSKATYPLLVNVQSDLLEELQTRVVIPLTRVAALTKKPVAQLMPAIEFNSDSYILMTPQLAGIAVSELGPVVGSLAARHDTILAAMDFLLSGY